MPDPRADFACLAKRCESAEGAAVYELPVAATRCPVCGSRRLRRIWTPPHIANGLAKKVDAIVEPEYVRQQQAHDAAKARQRVAPMFAVPHHQLGSVLAQYGTGLTNVGSGKAKPTFSPTDPDAFRLLAVKASGMNRPSRPVPLEPGMDHDKRWRSTA